MVSGIPPAMFFIQNFLHDNFVFSSDFYALDFLRFAWPKILPQSQFQTAKPNWRQFDTKSKMKKAPKTVPFCSLNLNNCIY